MHIRIIHQYFRTPEEGGGLRTWYMGKYLLSKGYKVSIVTGGSSSGYQCRLIEGMEVHYLPIYYSNHLGFLSRLHAFWLFVWRSIRLLRKLPKADIHYILTTPLTTGLIGQYFKKYRNIPYIFEVGDIWPEAPRQLKVLRNPVLLWLARYLEKKSYEGAIALAGLSPAISSYLDNACPGKPVLMLPNVSDTEYFKKEVKDPELEEHFQVQGKFVLSYIGTLGLANNLEYLLDAAAAIPKEANIQIIIMGDGARESYLKNYVQPGAPVRFLPHGSRDKVRDLLNVTDAVFISFKDIPVLSTGCPNKLLDGLAAGKLITLNFRGWIWSIVKGHSCGIHYWPDDPEGCWEKLQPFLEDPVKLEQYQENARNLAEAGFRPEVVFAPLNDFLSGLA